MSKILEKSPPPTLDDYPRIDRAGRFDGCCTSGEELRRLAAGGPRVSIVTIVRNGKSTLMRTAESVFSQDYPEIEYIIVDGASTDGTTDLLRSWEDRLAYWLSEPDLGVSDAFNKGIALSCGEIIGLLNSDDWYEPGAIGAVVAQMRRTGADIACGRLQYWEGDRRTYLVSSDPAQLDRGMTVGHPTVFVRRDSYRKFGLFRLDFRLAMDYEWLLRAKAAGARFTVIDRSLANMQDGGIGDRRWRDSQREVARARALHVPGAGNAFAIHTFVARRIFMGNVRRALDAAGLGVLRRAYHRWLSPVTVSPDHDDRAG